MVIEIVFNEDSSLRSEKEHAEAIREAMERRLLLRGMLHSPQVFHVHWRRRGRHAGHVMSHVRA